MFITESRIQEQRDVFQGETLEKTIKHEQNVTIKSYLVDITDKSRVEDGAPGLGKLGTTLIDEAMPLTRGSFSSQADITEAQTEDLASEK